MSVEYHLISIFHFFFFSYLSSWRRNFRNIYMEHNVQTNTRKR